MSSRHLTTVKWLRELILLAEEQGWRIELRKAGHLTWYPPCGGDFVITSQSPSDRRAKYRVRRDLRRYGLEI